MSKYKLFPAQTFFFFFFFRFTFLKPSVTQLQLYLPFDFVSFRSSYWYR
jgi:hypothetical protein